MIFKRKPTTLDVINSRRSISNFDNLQGIDRATIEKLIEHATKAPTAFNVQNWHFVAVHSDKQKAKLKEAAYGQQKVEDASVTFIVCGLLELQTLIARSLEASQQDEILSPEMVEGWVGAVNNMYGSNPTMQRDEAIRSASLGGMTLMLAAESMGMVSCPMIGFDPEAVKSQFNLPETAVPAMLIPIGFEGKDNWPQKPRLSTDDVLKIV